MEIKTWNKEQMAECCTASVVTVSINDSFGSTNPVARHDPQFSAWNLVQSFSNLIKKLLFIFAKCAN
jgi:hypothetical protein